MQHAPGIVLVHGFAENLAVYDHDRVGGQYNPTGSLGNGSPPLVYRHPAGVCPGVLPRVNALVNIGRSNVERDSGCCQELGAPGRR